MQLPTNDSLKLVRSREAVYTGLRTDDGVEVTVDPYSGERIALEEPVVGDFEWGYNGSGPRKLAEAMLEDAYGEQPNKVLAREFRDNYLAEKDRDENWVLPAKDLDEMVNDILDQTG